MPTADATEPPSGRSKGEVDETRRAFLDRATAFGSAGLLAVLGARFSPGFARYLIGPGEARAGSAGPARIASASLREGQGLVVAAAGRPVLLSRLGGTVRAVSAKCTHLGCTVRFDAATGEIACPCHGARYRAGGEVISGPTRTPLRSIPVREDGSDLVVGA